MFSNSIALEAPLVASPNQAMKAIQVSRKKLYELINTGELVASGRRACPILRGCDSPMLLRK